MNAEYLGVIFFILMFVLVGVVVTAIAINSIMRYNKCKDIWDNVEAEITNIHVRYDSDGDAHHNTEITYIHKEQCYTRNLGLYATGMHIGQTIKILVNPENSKEIMCKHSNTFLLLFGVIWTALSLFMFILVI